MPRSRGPGTLGATWYPANGTAEGEVRGAVLLLPPWVQWGRSYFHHRGRINALRRAGYHALTLDFPGFGRSGAPAGLFDRDVEDGLAFLRRRAGSLPVHVWGISSGGYWTHMVLSRTDGIAGAVFEDVSPHLFEWSWRMQPWGRPGYLFFHCAYRRAYRYMDVRRHAAALSVAAVSYIGGDSDSGIRREETEELALLAGGRSLIVAGAGHLASIKLAQAEILEMALDTFRRAERSDGPGSSADASRPAITARVDERR